MNIKLVLLSLSALLTGTTPNLAHSQSLRLGASQFSDGDEEATTSIDVIQDICNPVDDNNDGVIDSFTPETFSDSTVSITVYNHGTTSVSIRSLAITVPRATSDRKTLRSKWLAPISDPTVMPGETGTTVKFLVFDAEAGNKRVPGNLQNFPSNLGFRNVTIKLRGKTARGEAFTLSARHALSFDNFNRCS